MNKRDNIIKWTIVSIFVGLYLMVSLISTIHVIDFFRLSNPNWLAITLAIAFEVGAAASLAAIIILDKTNRFIVWSLFILITGIQMMGNMYYAYTHLIDYMSWVELFGLIEEEPIFQKRVISFVSGGILPIIALGFIKSLVDYIRPTKLEEFEDKIIDIPVTDLLPEVLSVQDNTEVKDEVKIKSVKYVDLKEDEIIIEEKFNIVEEKPKETKSTEDKYNKINKSQKNEPNHWLPGDPSPKQNPPPRIGGM